MGLLLVGSAVLALAVGALVAPLGVALVLAGLAAALVATVATLMLALAAGAAVAAAGGVRWLVRRGVGGGRPGTVALVVLVALPVHALVTVPLVLGWFGTRMVGTRGDERGYAGPRIAADGTWVLQSRASLAAERAGTASVDPAIATAAAARAVHFTSADGTPLRAFVVEPRSAPARASVVMVHGLFRCAIELEPVGSMFRDLGCEVVLLELRDHGGSGRGPATFGIREAEDVLAAVAWVRGRPAADRPLVLFGVSLGTAAVGIAAPRVEHLGGVVVDAPMDDALSTANRMFAHDRGGRARFTFPQPFRGLVLSSVELWAGIRLADVRPADALAALPRDVPILVIGGGDDDRMPPDEVRRVSDALPQPVGTKTLWIRDGAGHGDVWKVDPDGYREHLREFVDRVAPR